MIFTVTWAIQTEKLSKRFPPLNGWGGILQRSNAGLLAVDSVDLHIPKGELFGLLGPNGAGKTTLIKMLCTLIQPSSGTALVNGYALQQDIAIKASIGLVTSDERSFYWRLTGRQNLEFFARLHDIPIADIPERVGECLDQLRLGDFADQRFMTYATGIRQRLSIARSLLNHPEILFLDEPTKGLDPEASEYLHNLIRTSLVGGQGMTVLLTTHELNEAQELCDRIAVMNRGCIRACGTISELRNELGEPKSSSLAALYPALLEKPPESQKLHEESEQPALPSQPTHRPRLNAAKFLRLIAAFLKRDISTELSYPVAFILQIFGIFFSVGVFYFISRMIGGAAAPYLDQYGGDYFSFVLIGIAFASYFGVGLTSFANNLRQAQITGTLEAMLSTPSSISAIILSSATWDYLLTTLKVLVYLGIGTIILQVDLGSGNYLAAGVVLILTVIAFSSVGILAASFIMVLKRGEPVTWLFNAVSGLLGGVYYPLEVMPEWMQWLARWLPITYALEAMRKALLQGAPISMLRTEILALGLFCCILLPLSLYSFRFAVLRAKIEGSLTHY